MSPPLKSRQRHHACRMLVARTAEVRGGGENGAGDRPRGRRFDRPAVCGGKTGQGCGRGRETSVAADAVGAGAGRIATQVADLERTVAQISLNAKRGSEQYSLRTLQQRDDMRVEYLGTRDCSRLQLSRVRDHLRETRTGSLAVSRVARKAGRLPALRSCIRCCDRCSVAPAVLPCSDLDQIAV